VIVLVECYHDAALARALRVIRRNLCHESGKGNVVKRLDKMDGDAVGLLDADPGATRPRGLGSYEEAERTGRLRLLVRRGDPSKRVVEVGPRLEEWLVVRANASGVNLANHRLPETARELHRNPRCDRKPGFRGMLTELLETEPEMQTLRNWLLGR
jgi:hypothetical protein